MNQTKNNDGSSHSLRVTQMLNRRNTKHNKVRVFCTFLRMKKHSKLRWCLHLLKESDRARIHLAIISIQSKTFLFLFKQVCICSSHRTRSCHLSLKSVMTHDARSL